MGCERRGSYEPLLSERACHGGRVVDVVEVDSKEQPEASEHPEKDTLRMWRSRALEPWRR